MVFNNRCPQRTMALPVHAVHLSVNASGLANIGTIATALEWLLGITDCVEVERTSSFHGSPMFLLTASANRKGAARRAVPRLGTYALDALATSLDGRIDQSNCLHLRLALDGLVEGRATIIDAASPDEVVKVRIKLEVYPGDDAEEVAMELVSQARDTAVRKGLPESAEGWLSGS